MASTPFLVMPSTSTSYLNISGNVPHLAPSLPLQPPATTTGVVAHKHAHHLHSIPPRQKSTKSLILDHLLWLHALARIAHVGAELGISVIRDDVEDDVQRRGTSLCDALSYGQNIGKPALRLEKTRVDMVRGRALKARAEGLERVLAAMIDGQKDNGPLPDSVRFRLTLGAMINDVFASQPPAYPPADPTRTQRSPSSIPDALLPLSRPYSAITDKSSTLLPSFSSLTSSRASANFNSHTWSQPLASGSSQHSEPGSSQSLARPTNARAKDLFNTGIETESSPPQSPRCYRHLRHDCKSCTTQFASATTIGAGLSRSSDGRPFRPHQDSQAPDADLKSRVLEIIPHFLALSALVCAEITREEQRRRRIQEEDEDDASIMDDEDDVNRSSTSLASSVTTSTSGTQYHSSIGHRGHNSMASLPVEVPEEPKSRKLSLPFPFARSGSNAHEGKSPLSPLTKSSKSSVKSVPPVARPTREWYALLAGLLTRAVLEGYLLRNWKGTNAAEVVLNIGPTEEVDKKTRKLKKHQSKSIFSRKMPEDASMSTSAPPAPQVTTSPFLNPDGMPNLTEASSVLFGRSPLGKEGKADTGSEAFLDEYVKDMEKRLTEFLEVSPQACDLAAHLDTLSERYPAEPVEAGVLRFCEAIAVWRGKPELEEYKRGTDSMQMPVRSSPYTQTRDHVHSRSPSIHSSTSMVYQSPEKPRHQALSGHSAHDGGHGGISAGGGPDHQYHRSSASPSISIASLIHPPPSPSGYDSSDSVSVLPIAPPPKSLIDYFFTIEDPNKAMRSASEMDVVLPPLSTVLQQEPVVPKSRNPLDRWNPFSLGSKRPRDPVRDVILESDRASKKSFFVTSGKFNT